MDYLNIKRMNVDHHHFQLQILQYHDEEDVVYSQFYNHSFSLYISLSVYCLELLSSVFNSGITRASERLSDFLFCSQIVKSSSDLSNEIAF